MGISDAVLNHRLGADEKETFKATMVDQNDRLTDVGEAHDITAWTKWVIAHALLLLALTCDARYTFPGRGDKYSDFKYDFNAFTGVDWDEGSQTKAIFRIEGDGKYWAKGVDKESEWSRARGLSESRG